MMVRDDETLVRDHTSGAVESKRHDRIGDRCPRSLVIVDLIGGELKPAGPHILLKRLVDVLDHPHPFIGESRDAEHQRRSRHNQSSCFHQKSILLCKRW